MPVEPIISPQYSKRAFPGRICGWATTDAVTRKACVWDHDGTSIHPEGFVNSEATACNAHYIVGRGLDNLGHEHALIWTAPSKDVVMDLTDLATEWHGTPVPTAIDANNNITACTGTATNNPAWWLQAPRTDIFQIVKVFRPDDASATITWASQGGKRYQLWQTSSVSTAPWTKLGAPVTAVSPLTLSWDFDANSEHKYYRVEQLAQ